MGPAGSGKTFAASVLAIIAIEKDDGYTQDHLAKSVTGIQIKQFRLFYLGSIEDKLYPTKLSLLITS
jgi:hypothetical protein